MPTAPILDIAALKTIGAEPFGGADTGPWRQGGNAFGALGVLGTTDAFPLRFIAQNAQFLQSDGNLLALLAGAAGFTLDAGGDIAITTSTGGVHINASLGSVGLGDAAIQQAVNVGNITGNTGLRLRSGTLGISMQATGASSISLTPGATGDVTLPPRAAGAGNTTRLRFFDLGGVNAIGFQALDALAGSTTFRWPGADAVAANARAAMLTDAAGNLFFGNSMQSGRANIVNGVSAAIPANITAGSLIFCQAADVVPGAGNLTIDYRPLAADRVIGTPGSFKITAVLAAGTINVLDQSLGIQWFVLNP